MGEISGNRLARKHLRRGTECGGNSLDARRGRTGVIPAPLAQEPLGRFAEPLQARPIEEHHRQVVVEDVDRLGRRVQQLGKFGGMDALRHGESVGNQKIL